MRIYANAKLQYFNHYKTFIIEFSYIQLIASFNSYCLVQKYENLTSYAYVFLIFELSFLYLAVKIDLFSCIKSARCTSEYAVHVLINEGSSLSTHDIWIFIIHLIFYENNISLYKYYCRNKKDWIIAIDKCIKHIYWFRHKLYHLLIILKPTFKC